MQKKKLNKQQLKFCREWLKSHNAYDAAIKAGYSKSYAKNATKKLLENGGIQEYINKRTSKIEKQEDSEVDEVLANIYRIASGKPIKSTFVKTDNLKKQITLRTISKDSKPMPEMRAEYEINETVTAPASQKQQIAAAELWMKIKGQFKNDNAQIEDAKARKMNAEADIAEAKVKHESDTNDSHVSVNITMPGDNDDNN